MHLPGAMSEVCLMRMESDNCTPTMAINFQGRIGRELSLEIDGEVGGGDWYLTIHTSFSPGDNQQGLNNGSQFVSQRSIKIWP